MKWLCPRICMIVLHWCCALSYCIGWSCSGWYQGHTWCSCSDKTRPQGMSALTCTQILALHFSVSFLWCTTFIINFRLIWCLALKTTSGFCPGFESTWMRSNWRSNHTKVRYRGSLLPLWDYWGVRTTPLHSISPICLILWRYNTFSILWYIAFTLHGVLLVVLEGKSIRRDRGLISWVRSFT